MYGCNINITTNVTGIPYIATSGVSVTDASVDLSLGFRRIPKVGKFVIRIASAIPEGTTATLPVRVTLNGMTRPLIFFGGSAVTAADLVGTGIVEVWYDWFEGILQITSPVTAA